MKTEQQVLEIQKTIIDMNRQLIEKMKEEISKEDRDYFKELNEQFAKNEQVIKQLDWVLGFGADSLFTSSTLTLLRKGGENDRP